MVIFILLGKPGICAPHVLFPPVLESEVAPEGEEQLYLVVNI